MRAVVVLLGVLVLLAAGCGNSRRASLAKYINQVNAIENDMSVPLARAARANRAFTTHGDLRKLQPQLAQAVVTIHTLGRRLSALQPPPDAKPVAGLLAQLLTQEGALVADVHQTAVFLPAFDAGLERVTPLSDAFKRSARAAATTAEQEATLDTYVRELGPPIASLRRLRPPPILRPTYTVQLSALARSRTTAAALAAALQAKNNAQFVLDLALALGDESLTTGDPARDGEPYGELGMVEPGDALWPSPPSPPPGPPLGQILQQALPHMQTHGDNDGSLTVPAVQATPSLQLLQPPMNVPGVDQYDQALLNRLAILGRLTASDVAWVLANVQNPPQEIWQLTSRGLVVPTAGGGFTASQLLEIDLGLANAPVITGATMQATPTTPIVVTGTGDAGDTVRVYDGGALVGLGTVAANGTWTISILLGVGRHDLTATQMVNLPPNAGLLSAVSHDVNNVTVAPDAPAIGTVSAASGGVAVSGTGAPGDTVTVYDNGHQVGSAVVAANGTWTVSVTLQSGVHALTAGQTVFNPPGGPGNLTSAVSPAVSVVRSGAAVTPYVPPVAPVILAISPPQPTTGNAHVTLNGTGIAGDSVVVYDNGIAVGQTNIGGNGTWKVDLNLAVGAHALTAAQYLVSGAPGTRTAVWTVTVNAPTPQPTLVLPKWSVVAGSPTAVVGGGVAGDLITVYDGAVAIGTTTVLANGVWTLAVSLAAGQHVLTATQTDPHTGLVSNLSQNGQITVYALPGVAPIVSVATINGHTTVTGSGAAPGDTITIYDGTIPIGSAHVDNNGNWSLQLTLAAGAHSLHTTQTVATGVTGGASAAFSVTI